MSLKRRELSGTQEVTEQSPWGFGLATGQGGQDGDSGGLYFIHQGMGFWDTCLYKVWGLLYTCMRTSWVWRVKKGAEGHVFPALYTRIALSFPNINSMTCVCLCRGKRSRISELVNVLEYWRTTSCCSGTVNRAWGLKSEATLDGWNCLRFWVFVERVGVVSATQGFGGS